MMSASLNELMMAMTWKLAGGGATGGVSRPARIATIIEREVSSSVAFVCPMKSTEIPRRESQLLSSIAVHSVPSDGPDDRGVRSRSRAQRIARPLYLSSCCTQLRKDAASGIWLRSGVQSRTAAFRSSQVGVRVLDVDCRSPQSTDGVAMSRVLG